MYNEPVLHIYAFSKENNALIVASQESGPPLDHSTAGGY